MSYLRYSSFIIGKEDLNYKDINKKGLYIIVEPFLFIGL
jgi:hypothetical protein